MSPALPSIQSLYNRRLTTMAMPCRVLRILHWAIVTPFMAAVCLTSSPAHPQEASKSASAKSQSPSETRPGNGKPDAKKAKRAYNEGIRAERAEDWQAAYEAYSKATSWTPANHEYALRYQMARGKLVQSKVDRAERNAVSGRLSEARKELAGASFLDPSNTMIATRLAELGAMEWRETRRAAKGTEPAGLVRLVHEPGKHSFDFRGDTQGAYQEIARQFGVRASYDGDLPSRPVHFRFDDVDFRTAMELLGDMTGTFWRPLTEHLFFVAADTPQKRKDYDASAVQTIFLPASESREQMTEVLRVVREVTGITHIGLDAESRTITLRASPHDIALAADLIDSMEKPVGELILEIEILEVDRNTALEFGLTPPEHGTIYTISSQEITEAQQSESGLINVIEQVLGTSSLASGIPPVIAFGGGISTFLATLPGAAANLSEMLSLVRYGRRILLRAEDGQPATFFVGERFPVSLSQYSASLVSGSGSGVSSLISPISNYATGTTPSFVATTSLRSNGMYDLIVANAGDNTISVLLGDGQGVFAPQVTYPTGTDPVSIAAGQFNTSTTATNSNDFVDLAVADKGANTVSILLGNGDGTFQPKTDIATGVAPVSVITADFHDLAGTGFTDLAVANQGDNTISIFQSNGDGTFMTPTLITLPAGYAPSALAAADLNNDGHIDLVVADQGNNTVSVFLGNGDGTFQTRADYATGNSPVSVALADFTGNGALDIAVANNGATTSSTSGNSVTVYYNQLSSTSVPLGTFVAGSTRDFAAGNGPTSIVIADYNVDGSPDIAVADEADNAVTVLINAGNQLFTALPELPVGTAPVSIASADFNGDGRPDAATADSGAAEATVILNTTSLFGASVSSSGTLFPNVQYLDLGLKVKATPRIHQDGEVTLQLHLDISSLAGQSFNGIPVLANDTFEQTVRLKENETSALAGILQPQVTSAIEGTPGVTGLPGLGDLLSNRNIQNQDSELLILITPRMVALAPRKDRTIYAGRGRSQGSAAPQFLREGRPEIPPPPAPQTPTPPQPQPPPQPQ
jgi:hypothetical protein